MRLVWSLVILMAGGIAVSGSTLAQSKIRNFDNPHRLLNRYIVTLKDNGPEWRLQPSRDAALGAKLAVLAHNKNQVQALAQEFVGRFGGRVVQHYSSTIIGFAIEFDEASAKRLAQDPRVAIVEPDEPTIVSSVQSNAPWHLDRIDEQNRPLNGDYVYYRTGQNITIEILDTGVREDHNEYDDRSSGGPNWTLSGNADGSWEDQDCHGHGTHVAGIAAGRTYGVAKGAHIGVQIVAKCDGTGNVADLLQGVDSVTADYQTGPLIPTVANISAVTANPSGNIALRSAIQRSIAAGVIWVAAAGNQGQDACNYLPAAIPEVITVGASSRSDTVLVNANVGGCIDILAPGDRVKSAWRTSRTATTELTGTSQAAPQVTGAVAMYLESFPQATPAQVEVMLKQSASKNKLSGDLHGSPNLLLNIGVATSNLPDPTPDPPDPSEMWLKVMPAIFEMLLSE